VVAEAEEAAVQVMAMEMVMEVAPEMAMAMIMEAEHLLHQRF
jgi:hypothetical protein